MCGDETCWRGIPAFSDDLKLWFGLEKGFVVRGMLKDKVTGSGMSYIDAELSIMFRDEKIPARLVC